MKKILLLLLFLSIIACKDKKLMEAQGIVGEWMGKEIRFPDNVLCAVMGKDTVLDACQALNTNSQVLIF
jgi:hypothetical protein